MILLRREYFFSLLLGLPSVVHGQNAASSRTKTCVVTHTPNADDSPAVMEALKNCAVNATVVFSQNVEYNLWTPVSFTLNNVLVSLLGNISLPENITQVQAGVRSSAYKGAWLFFSGNEVDIVGTGVRDRHGGWVKGHGQQWWDAMNQVNRPGIFSFKASNGILRDLKIDKPIAKSFNIAANNVLAEEIYIDSHSGTSAFPFNTDGFDVGGDNVTIQDSTVLNGDDCVAIGSPSSNFVFRRNTCVGTHGVSINAKGSPVSISNILVEDVTIVDSLYGMRFKADGGGVGSATNITYKNIVVHNVTFPIYITQNYFDQSVGPPNGTFNSSVQINGLFLSSFVGDINSRHPGDGSCITDPCWYAVSAADGTQVVILDDLYANTTKNMRFTDLFIIPDEPGRHPTVICDPSKLADGDDLFCPPSDVFISPERNQARFCAFLECWPRKPS